MKFTEKQHLLRHVILELDERGEVKLASLVLEAEKMSYTQYLLTWVEVFRDLVGDPVKWFHWYKDNLTKPEYISQGSLYFSAVMGSIHLIMLIAFAVVAASALYVIVKVSKLLATVMKKAISKVNPKGDPKKEALKAAKAILPALKTLTADQRRQLTTVMKTVRMKASPVAYPKGHKSKKHARVTCWLKAHWLGDNPKLTEKNKDRLAKRAYDIIHAHLLILSKMKLLSPEGEKHKNSWAQDSISLCSDDVLPSAHAAVEKAILPDAYYIMMVNEAISPKMIAKKFGQRVQQHLPKSRKAAVDWPSNEDLIKIAETLEEQVALKLAGRDYEWNAYDISLAEWLKLYKQHDDVFFGKSLGTVFVKGTVLLDVITDKLVTKYHQKVGGSSGAPVYVITKTKLILFAAELIAKNHSFGGQLRSKPNSRAPWYQPGKRKEEEKDLQRWERDSTWSKQTYKMVLQTTKNLLRLAKTSRTKIFILAVG